MSLSFEAQPLPLVTDADGAIRVGKTRVTLETVVRAYKAGYSPEEIVMQFPALQLADVYAVIAYYLHYRAEVEAYLQQVEQEANQIRQQLEANTDRAGIRERLLARQNNAQN